MVESLKLKALEYAKDRGYLWVNTFLDIQYLPVKKLSMWLNAIGRAQYICKKNNGTGVYGWIRTNCRSRPEDLCIYNTTNNAFIAELGALHFRGDDPRTWTRFPVSLYIAGVYVEEKERDRFIYAFDGKQHLYEDSMK